MKTNQLPKVAVLLAAYNGEKYIQEQIESIVNQVDVDVYIYISIDASTDRTLDICKQLQKTYKNIFIINDGKERFGSAGKNFYHLIKNVNFKEHDYVALSDQDDIWKPLKIIRGIQVLEKERASGYSSDVECFWDDRSRKNKIIKKSYPQKKYDYIFESAGPGCTYILNIKFALNFQKSIKKISNLPFHHDWFIYAYARHHNIKWQIDNHPNIYYRQHANNQVGANINFAQYIKRLKKIKNGIFKNEYKEILSTLQIPIQSSFLKRKSILKTPLNYRRKTKDALLIFIFQLLNWI